MSKLTESLFSNKELRRKLEEIDESCPNEISHVFEHILLFADKLDVTKVRQNKKYTSKNNQDNYIETIEEVNFKIEGKNFIVEIIKNKEKNLKEWDYFKKMEERVIEFANKINKTGKITEKVE